MGCHWLLQCEVNCNLSEIISTERWKRLETKAKDWKGLDKFGNAFESTDWEEEALARPWKMLYQCMLDVTSKM